MRLYAVVGLLLAVWLAPTVGAEQVALSGFEQGGCYLLAFTIDAPVLWLTPDRFRSDVDPKISAIGSPDGRRVLGLLRTYADQTRVLDLGPDGSQKTFFDGLTGYDGFSLAVANTGRVFVSVAQVGLRRVAAISPAGSLEGTYPLPVSGGGELAVASDGCTLYFTQSGGVGRMNGCSGALLADFLTTTEQINDVRALSDGNVLVAFTDAVVLYDASGAYVRRIVSLRDLGLDQYQPQELGVSSDGQTLWIGASDFCFSAQLVRVSMNDGRELSRQLLAFNNVTGIVVGAPSSAAIPTLSDAMLALTALVLAAAGALVLRGH